MHKLANILKRVFWKLPIPMSWKKMIRGIFPQNKDIIINSDREIILSELLSEQMKDSLIKQMLNIPTHKNKDYVEFSKNEIGERKAVLVAYYLTQYHPTEKNNLWWGKGTTEWTNVTKAVPQFVGHNQPKLPGSLGFYDLRIVDNMYNQVDIAKNYGIDAFSFYYYWFNGERVLETPLNQFCETKDIDFKFCLCWCNEDWTRRYSGVNNETLLSIGKTKPSYEQFIFSVLPYLNDERYLTIDGKLVLTIYRPSNIPDSREILQYWRDIVANRIGKELYILASEEANIDIDWSKRGFDAMSQFQPASVVKNLVPQNSNYQILRSDFSGDIYNYESIAVEKHAIPKIYNRKIYPAVMPSWDNTSRRNNKGTIFAGSSPRLYKSWLEDSIEYVSKNVLLDSKLIFINAWNEWGEGAYLEPDREYGYAYLQATFEANTVY